MPRNGLSRPRNKQHQRDSRQVPDASLTWHPEVLVRSRAPMDRAVCFPGR